MSARVIQVIETDILRGEGRASDDPVRRVTQYWSFDGTLLAENDPCPRASRPARVPHTERRG